MKNLDTIFLRFLGFPWVRDSNFIGQNRKAMIEINGQGFQGHLTGFLEFTEKIKSDNIGLLIGRLGLIWLKKDLGNGQPSLSI
jgi:hypothetical protein